MFKNIRQRLLNKAKNLKAPVLLKEFCENTTIHGFNFLIDKKKTWLERLFWFVMILMSIAACTLLIDNAYDKWSTRPVIVSFNERLTPIFEVPFPAVTICTGNKFKYSTTNFTQLMFSDFFEGRGRTWTKDERMMIDVMAQVCEQGGLMRYDPGFSTIQTDPIPFLKRASPSFDETFSECKYRNRERQGCGELFYQTVSEDGLCWTFNGLNYHDILREEAVHGHFKITNGPPLSKWQLEDGYDPEIPVDSYPYRATTAGSRSGLSVVLKLYESDMVKTCRGPLSGFELTLHTPGEPFGAFRYSQAIAGGQDINVAIIPQLIETSDTLTGYSPTVRQCYFNHERYLRYFKSYTQANCEYECLTNRTLEECGCVHFAMPRSKGTPVCGIHKRTCIYEIEDTFSEFGLESSLASKKSLKSCGCLPLCTSIEYDVEISQADFVLETNRNSTDDAKYTKLMLFFKNSQFIASKRSELYGMTDFVANCGGLLGLFMGVSLLSLVELVYFFIIRLLQRVVKFMRNKLAKPKLTEPRLYYIT